MLKPLDYILDNENNFWIVSHIQDDVIYGKLVYKVNKSGNRFNPVTNLYYEKMYGPIIKMPTEYKEHFEPRKFYIEHKKYLDGVWKKYVEALNIIGIPDDCIGIFGSYLLGFEIEKDVDFIIYKMDNLRKYYDNATFIKEYTKTTFITKNHIDYQYKKYKDGYHPETDLEKILSRNWSGIQIGPGKLSTPRFIIDENYLLPSLNGKDEEINCTVISGLTSACYPRYTNVLYNNMEYKMITPFWMYQSFACDNDHLMICGNINHETKTILLQTKDHYIKYLK